MELIIRKLEKNDFIDYIQLINQLRPIGEDVSYEKYIEIYNNIFTNNVIFVAEYNKKLVGSITLLIEQKFIHNFSKYGRIEDVVVDLNYRNQNIGKKLVEYVIEYGKEKQLFKITLTCKEHLKYFYGKNNFEVYDIHMSQLL
jgi:glucosamine-phosphate N-acetyltransferase